jgi:signal transduction histidine kinase
MTRPTSRGSAILYLLASAKLLLDGLAKIQQLMFECKEGRLCHGISALVSLPALSIYVRQDGGGPLQLNHPGPYSPTFPRGPTLRFRFVRISLLLLFILSFSPRSLLSVRTSPKKNILILTDVGLSPSMTAVMTQQIVAGVQETPTRHMEYYSESLDLASFPKGPSREETRAWIEKKYGSYKLDVIVAVGPDAIDFLSKYSTTLFPDVPVVISGASADQLSDPSLDSRFTGTWLKLEPKETIAAALRLFPDTRHVYVVAGSSSYDQVAVSLTKTALGSFNTKAEILYLTGMEMGALVERLQDLPDHSIILYLSFFQDSTGNKFLNVTKALPVITAASNGPDFGMSETYIGHGIVGGYVMPFETQGKISAQIVSDLLDGKSAREISIGTIPAVCMFDWRQLQTWHIPESRLPAGSVILFREPSLWQRAKWTSATVLAIILGLTALAIYLQYSRKQLRLATDRQMELSGRLINAEEDERRRMASELHDDFSQRVAILSLGLENAQEATPASFSDLRKQLRHLVSSTTQLGDDLHALSHRLHSSTIESLGLVTAVSALCTEFTATRGIRVGFSSEGVDRSVHPDAGLCIFRIVQESLSNLKKYSGAEKADVELRTSGDRLKIIVRDNGRGFDLSNLRHIEGIGVRSMEERARHLGGKFEIHSEPGKGTTVEAWVPFNPAARSAAS